MDASAIPISAGWTSLEAAKLVVSALVPIAVVALGVPIARSVRRLEQAQWQSRKLTELRLELYAQMAGPLNDLLCFFRRVGDFQEITPPKALQHKRALDKAFWVNERLMSPEFARRYQDFMGACFRVYTGPGRPALLRASGKQQRAERQHWDTAWDNLLIPESSTPIGLAELGRHYDALMECFGREIGVRNRQPPERRRIDRKLHPVSFLVGVGVSALVVAVLVLLAR